jgi:Protein kinase domain
MGHQPLGWVFANFREAVREMVYSGDPSTFVPSHLREMSTGEQWLVDRTAESFLTTGKWPKLNKLVRSAARRDVDLPEVIYGMPLQDFIWRPDNDGTVVLSVPGLWRSSTGGEFSERFLEVVLLCRDIFLEDDEDEDDEDDANGMPRITSDNLKSRLGFDDALVAQIRAVMPFEYFLTAGGNTMSDTDWFSYVNQTVAKFRGVESLEQYFEVRASIVAPRTFSAPWPPIVAEHLQIPDSIFGNELEHDASGGRIGSPADGSLQIQLVHLWTVGEQINEGGFGRVFEAHDQSGHGAVVKLVPKEPGAQRELLMADLTGVRNVVPVIDSGEFEDSYVLVMPRADYSLQDWIGRNAGSSLDPESALAILVDVATALADLDGRVVHRDLKPANLLFLAGSWCVSDFGISRYADASTATHTRKLSLSAPYAAPERWRAEQRNDPLFREVSSKRCDMVCRPVGEGSRWTFRHLLDSGQHDSGVAGTGHGHGGHDGVGQPAWHARIDHALFRRLRRYVDETERSPEYGAETIDLVSWAQQLGAGERIRPSVVSWLGEGPCRHLGDVGGVDGCSLGLAEGGIHDSLVSDHVSPHEGVGHEGSWTEKGPGHSTGFNHVLTGQVPTGDRVGAVVASGQHGQLHDMADPGFFGRRHQVRIVLGTLRTAREEEDLIGPVHRSS